ncbi:MAG: hypothetical protein V4710_22075 [Verrucomicrobiota bacterium]
MEEDLESQWEREAVNGMMEDFDRDKLLDYLLNNPFPAYNCAVYCNEEYLPKLFDVVIDGAFADIEHELSMDMAVDLLSAFMRRMAQPYKGERFLSDSFGEVVIDCIRRRCLPPPKDQPSAGDIASR